MKSNDRSDQTAGRRVLVTGAAGMLASALIPALRTQENIVISADVAKRRGIQYLDVTERQSTLKFIKECRPNIVVHLAAKTNLEECETNPQEAFMVNGEGTLNVALACREVGATMAYVSTVGVFDGSKSGPYIETDIPNPINVYGQTKYEGEKFVAENTDRHYIVRTSWLMGGRQRDYKFVGMIINQIMRGSKRIMAVNDKFGSPTYIKDLASYLVRLLSIHDYGLYHVSNAGGASRFDVAREIISHFGRKDIELIPVSSSVFAKRFPAPRPRCEVMDSAMLPRIGLKKPRPWQRALEEYLTTEWGDLIT